MKEMNWLEVMKFRPELVTGGLTEKEEGDLRGLLPKIQIGGRMSLPVFLWRCAAFGTSALEGIFLREKGNWVVRFLRKLFGCRKFEVLLKTRAKNPQDVYSEKLDIFGTVMMPTDALPQSDPDWIHPVRSYKHPLKRILGEAGLTEFGAEPKIINGRLFDGDRGMVQQIIAICTVPNNQAPTGEWYPVDNLPDDLIWEHHSLIALAVGHL